MKNRSRIYNLKNQIRTMNEEQFADIELKLRSLRTEDLAPEDEFIVIDFKEKYDGLIFIQAMSVKSFKACRVEIAFERKGKNFPAIFARNDVPIDETVEIFKSVCCSVSKPDLSDWQIATEEILLLNDKEDK